jgi:hypothetical protein
MLTLQFEKSEACAQAKVKVIDSNGKVVLTFKLADEAAFRPKKKVEVGLLKKKVVTYDRKRKPVSKAVSEGYSQADLQNSRQAHTKVDEVEEITTFDDTEDNIQAVGVHKDSSLFFAPTDPYVDQKLSKVLKRNFEIASFQWDGNAAQGDALDYIGLPDALVSKPFISDILQRFRWFKGHIKLGFRINSTPFHYGALLISWVPQYNGNSGYARFKSLDHASANPHIIVSANSRQVVNLTIPWINNELMIQQGTSNAIGTVGIFVLSQLKQMDMTDVPVVDVTVFANFEDIQTTGIYAQADYGRDVKSKPDSQEKEAQKASKEGLLSSTLASGAGLAAMFATADFRAGALGLSSILKFGSMLFKALGYSKETERLAASPVRVDMTSPMAHGSGLDSAKKLALVPENHVVKDHTIFGTNRDYDLLRELVLIPSIYMKFNWAKNSTPNNNLLARWVVSPTGYMSDGVSNNIGSTTWVNPTNTLAACHRYWRGGMKYSLRFFTSNFISGRLRIVWMPTMVPSSIATEEGNIISEVIDITGDTTFDFTIPYCHSRPMLRCGYNTTFSTDFGGYVNGTIGLYPVTDLVTATPATEASVDVVIYASGGEDLVFSIPQDMGSISYAFGTDKAIDPGMGIEEKKSEAYAQSETDLDPRHSFQRVFKPLNPAKAIAVSNLVVGEHTSRVSEILSRYIVLTDNTASSSLQLNNTLSAFQNLTVATGTPTNGLGVWRALSLMFHGHRGSMRYKFVAHSVSKSLESNYWTAATNDNLPWINLTLTTLTSNNHMGSDISGLQTYRCDNLNALEWEVPYIFWIFSKVLLYRPYLLCQLLS